MAEETLSIDERLKLLRRQREAYRQADKAEKGRMLDTLQEMLGLRRETIIRRLNGRCERKRRRRQRGRAYGPEVDDALRVIHEAYDGICAERLTPNLPAYAAKLAVHGHLRLSPELKVQLGRISVSTVRRILQRIQQDEPLRQRRRRSPPRNGLLAGVPAGRICCYQVQPGYLEVDLVHHCGRHTLGEYLHTLHLVDVATGWSEMAAVLGRSYRVMEDGFQRCAARLPFAVQEIHPDNGSEFFNAHLLRFFGQRFRGAAISRSRPWRKNDNRFVEHRNGALIRRWLGHERLDSVAQARALNAFYDLLWLYHNFFQPVMRIAAKEVDPRTRRIRRRWDAARTPFERLLAVQVLTDEQAAPLQALYERTDPRALRERLQRDVRALFALPGAQADHSEDVFATLGLPLTITI